ncbi:hypothetical protein L3X38_030737 [Prunus dulcis]|uniref:Uncharacterized protein n=1 Tax=Prunus dulcis TaxID=3755 RepID=A0AAD4YUC5_PRUDU|nr:hypothetical protein L3X38_030737 [Prunus dulcis]
MDCLVKVLEKVGMESAFGCSFCVQVMLPKCCTVEAFEFAANVCPGLVTLSLPGDLLDSKHANLELIGKWKTLEGAKVNQDGLVTLLCGCKDLVMLGATGCFGFNENDDETSKLASHISKFMCKGSEFPEFICGMDNFVLLVDGYSFHLHVEETWDEMLNDLRDAFNDLGDEK